MRERTDRSIENLCRKLEVFEEHLRNLRWRMDPTSTGTSRDSLGREIEIAEAAVKRIKDDALAARARMQIQEEEGALTDSGQVEAWKSDREREKLRSRAEDAEAYAAWALIVATRSIDEAELATLKAIANRMDFENGSTE